MAFNDQYRTDQSSFTQKTATSEYFYSLLDLSALDKHCFYDRLDFEMIKNKLTKNLTSFLCLTTTAIAAPRQLLPDSLTPIPLALANCLHIFADEREDAAYKALCCIEWKEAMTPQALKAVMQRYGQRNGDLIVRDQLLAPLLTYEIGMGPAPAEARALIGYFTALLKREVPRNVPNLPHEAQIGDFVTFGEAVKSALEVNIELKRHASNLQRSWKEFRIGQIRKLPLGVAYSLIAFSLSANLLQLLQYINYTKESITDYPVSICFSYIYFALAKAHISSVHLIRPCFENIERAMEYANAENLISEGCLRHPNLRERINRLAGPLFSIVYAGWRKKEARIYPSLFRNMLFKATGI